MEHLSRTQLVSHLQRDYLSGKLSDYHFIRLHFTTFFDGITTISFWWRRKVLDNKFCHGFNSSRSGIFTFNGFNGPFQPELSERRVTIMDLHSHILEIQLMPCHRFVLIKTRRFSFVKTLQNIQSLPRNGRRLPGPPVYTFFQEMANHLGWGAPKHIARMTCLYMLVSRHMEIGLRHTTPSDCWGRHDNDDFAVTAWAGLCVKASVYRWLCVKALVCKAVCV